MEFIFPPGRLDRMVNHEKDPVLGAADAGTRLSSMDAMQALTAGQAPNACHEREINSADECGMFSDIIRPWAGVLSGLGFTMSRFIARQAFPDVTDFSAAKITVLPLQFCRLASGHSALGRSAPRAFKRQTAKRL